VAEHWIDAADIRAREGEDLSRWWTVFNDATLNRLVAMAYRQNLSLREAGFRVLEARAQKAIAVGELFPQQQDASGSYARQARSTTSSLFPLPKPFFDQWNMGFSLAWELDFWGRFRRAVAAADAQLDASVEGYDDVLVTLLSDVAANYVQVRTLQERIRWLRYNVALQQWVKDGVERRLRGGFRANILDVQQAVSLLEQTESQIPELEIGLRLATNRLCILMGMPPADLANLIGEDRIPTAPPEVVIGIPAELLRRRPDVRRAERLAAAQAEQIGIAEADLYPAISINGTLGYQARNFSDLFSAKSLNGNVGPSFQWNVLNYGRIAGNVRFQDARFQELVTAYQNTVLAANEEAENGIVTFLRAQRREGHLDRSVRAAKEALKTMKLQRDVGGMAVAVDFNRYALIAQNLVQQQDLWAQSRGEIAQGLIQVYRALGGGWEVRLEGGPAMPAGPPSPPTLPEEPSLVPGLLETPQEPPAPPKTGPGQPKP
jgi:NodT family efflux transporter outer membrane factor (OMF) lipoprotein